MMMDLNKLDIISIRHDEIFKLLEYDPAVIVSLFVNEFGSVTMVNLKPEAIETGSGSIFLPDMEDMEEMNSNYQIFGINMTADNIFSIDSIGFNAKILRIAHILIKRMKEAGYKNIYFPAFLRRPKNIMEQPWCSLTSFFFGDRFKGDQLRFIRGGCVRFIDNEHYVFAHNKDLMLGTVKSFQNGKWDCDCVVSFPSEIKFIGRPNGFIIPVTLVNGDVYECDSLIEEKHLNLLLFKRIANNVKVWVGKTKIKKVAFFRGKELILMDDV